MARAIRPFVDKALGGKLTEELQTRKANGDSFDTIAQWLLLEHGIPVTSETLRNWLAADTEATAS